MLAGLAAGAVAALLPAAAAAAPAGQGTVRHVPRGDLLALEDGRTLRLAGLVVPGPLSGHPDAVTLAERAREALELIAAGRQVAFAVLARDRHGRDVVEARAAGPAPLQALLAGEGLAWAWPEPPAEALYAAGREAEEAARSAGRGLWSVPALAPVEAERVRAGQARFALVRGRVLETARQRRHVYLNFGADWRRDFTVRVPLAAARAMERTGLDLLALAGRRIEVRGWLFSWGGPMIEAVEHGQIEEIA